MNPERFKLRTESQQRPPEAMIIRQQVGARQPVARVRVHPDVPESQPVASPAAPLKELLSRQAQLNAALDLDKGEAGGTG
jgi:hypothetical protein